MRCFAQRQAIRTPIASFLATTTGISNPSARYTGKGAIPSYWQLSKRAREKSPPHSNSRYPGHSRYDTFVYPIRKHSPI